MDETHLGIIVEESLTDNRLINELKILKIKISDEESPLERGHLYTVKISKRDIKKLANRLKERWYAHFRKGREIIVIFRNKKFEFDFDNKTSWEPAVKYGLSMGIPKEQLDFLIDEELESG